MGAKADALTEVVDKARTDVVLIVDDVQQALAGEDGALQGKHAFAGATSVDYPTLDGDYVAHVPDGIALEGARVQPSLAAAVEAFDTLGRRPEELIRALRQLQQEDPAEADRFLPVIAATLKTAAADVELRKVEDLGTLAGAVFDRVARAKGHATGLFGAQALADYTAQLAREVTADQVQRVADELRDANLIIRKGHGVYAVTDPFVQAAWQERRALTGGADPAP